MHKRGIDESIQIRSLARFGGRHPLAGEFLEDVRVTNTAMVKRSLTSLCNLRLIYVFANEYRFASPFFRKMDQAKMTLLKS